MIADVEIRDAGTKGSGVFSLRDFPMGAFIFRRRYGRIVANRDIPSLPAVDRVHLCELDFDTSAVLLPPGCYLNHACDPNAMRSGVKVFAWQPIRAGEEITIDYRLNAFGGDRWTCACGSPGCTGEVVGSFFSLDEDQQRLYLPFAPAFIQLECRRQRDRARVAASDRPC
ncbi:MAG: SET domain-containing protein-lysine N-methyltransferase [Candidatus Dormibacteria bacterium]